MDGEFYERDGRFFDRPTHMLDYFAPPELVEWKVKTGFAESNRISRIALRHGSKIDELVRTNKAPKKSDSPEVLSCWKAWEKWKNDYAPGELLFPETQYDDVRLIAGTPDIYWPLRRMIIDVKSSKMVRPSYFFQTGGAYAGFKSLPFPVERVGILRLDKELEDYEFVTNEQLGLSLPLLQKGFNGLVDYYKVYKLVQSTLKPKEKVYDGNDSEDANA